MFINPDPNLPFHGTSIIYFPKDPEELLDPPLSPTPVPAPPPAPTLPYAQLARWFFDNHHRLVGIRRSNHLGGPGFFSQERPYGMLLEDQPMANTGETSVEPRGLNSPISRTDGPDYFASNTALNTGFIPPSHQENHSPILLNTFWPMDTSLPHPPPLQAFPGAQTYHPFHNTPLCSSLQGPVSFGLGIDGLDCPLPPLNSGANPVFSPGPSHLLPDIPVPDFPFRGEAIRPLPTDEEEAMKREQDVYTQTSPFRQARWGEDQGHVGTISPKELRRIPSPLLSPKVETPPFALQQRQDHGLPSDFLFKHEEEPVRVEKSRRILPSSPAKPRLVAISSATGVDLPDVPILPSNGLLAGESEKKHDPSASKTPIKDDKVKVEKGKGDSRRPLGKASQFSPPTSSRPLRGSSSKMHTANGRGANGASSFPGPSSPLRSARDEFLVRSKLEGMTYRQIRLKGGFTEAESTLRGRFRTLTKSKEARVRKPEWTEADIKLLRKAVRGFSQGKNISKVKIPWKLVAEYIVNHGGSYHFGNATCRKKWDEITLSTRV